MPPTDYLLCILEKNRKFSVNFVKNIVWALEKSANNIEIQAKTSTFKSFFEGTYHI